MQRNDQGAVGHMLLEFDRGCVRADAPGRACAAAGSGTRAKLTAGRSRPAEELEFAVGGAAAPASQLPRQLELIAAREAAIAVTRQRALARHVARSEKRCAAAVPSVAVPAPPSACAG